MLFFDRSQLVSYDNTFPNCNRRLITKRNSQSEIIPSLQFEIVQQDHETAHEYRHKLSRGFSQAVVKEIPKEKTINVFFL